MKGKMKKMLLAMGLCLIVGLQSAGAVQAAVNYEACPFCGTMVTRNTVAKECGRRFVRICMQHTNCKVFEVTYDYCDQIRCETGGCTGNQDIMQNRPWSSLQHCPY